MDRNVQYLIQHSIFKQDAFGIPVDDLPTLCQRYKRTIATVCLTTSKIVTKGVLDQQATANLLKEAASAKHVSKSPPCEVRQVDTREATAQVPHSECTRYTLQHVE